MTTTHDAFELGMHAAFKKAGVKTAAEAQALFKVARDILEQRQHTKLAMTAYELGLRKIAADHGLLSAEEQDAFVEAARKVAGENADAIRGLLGAGMVGAGVGAAAGVPVGMVQGAFADKDSPVQSRKLFALKKILRAALVGASAGGSAVAGGTLGGLAGHGAGRLAGLGASATDKLRGGGTTAGMVGGGLAGGLAANRLIDKLGSEKTAALGALIGALRKKDPGESRTHSVLRSAGTDVATQLGAGAGITAGGIGGAHLGLKSIKGKDVKSLEDLIQKVMTRGAGGALAGGAVLGTAGGVGAYQLAKRKPLTVAQKAKGKLKDLKKKVTGK